VVGVDFSDEAIKSIEENGINGEFSVGTVSSIPHRTDSFDVVHCFSVLYHIINDDAWGDAVAEPCRVLKPGGVLVLRIAWQEKEQDMAEHVRFRSKGEYKHRLKAAGVTNLSTHPIYDEPWMPTITSRISYILHSSLLWTENEDQKIIVGEKTRNCD
jgi:2-polyprenyl-3-methyl-5-hydroxy-6-metoxy-1,4-benzoquinol methylase